MEEINQAIILAENLQGIMGNVLPTFLLGTKSFIEGSSNPNVQASGNQSLHILNGSLIVYLFAMWDSFTIKKCEEKYFKPDELKYLNAFKHIRNVAAHNIEGNRKGNFKNQDKMQYDQELDEIQGSERKIHGLVLEDYRIDLSQSNAALDCRQFLQNMATQLASGRISLGGPNGQVKSSSGTTEAL